MIDLPQYSVVHPYVYTITYETDIWSDNENEWNWNIIDFKLKA